MDRDKPPVTFSNLLEDYERTARLVPLLAKSPSLGEKYRPWRKVRHIAKDSGVDPVDAWWTIKWDRLRDWRSLPIIQSGGKEFGYSAGSHLFEPLYRIDRATGGGGSAAFESPRGFLADETHRQRLRIRTLMDEAAESSLIEGAATTRKDAVEMLRSARSPKTKGERMVVNNYVAMQQVKEWTGRSLSKEMLLELQTTLTRDTLGNEDEAGRFRRSDERVRVVDERTDREIYVPPPAEGLHNRIASLCAFANQDHSGKNFIHPIVKACVLHFMIGYEHPFVDGNGRTARAIFYWFTLRHGYRIFEYIPISEKIRKGYARYPEAYLDTELDDGDLTYFILYKLDIIEQSLTALAEHLKNEEEKIKRSELLLKSNKGLNLRQRILLEHALRHPTQRYTVKSHASSNGTTLVTARTDLEILRNLRLLTSFKDGREEIYLPAATLAEKVAGAAKKRKG